jgi:hypothetical protein
MPGAKPHTRYQSHTEAQELRRMLREKQRENERLRSEVELAYKQMDRHTDELSDRIFGILERIFIDALEGGGDDHASN